MMKNLFRVATAAPRVHIGNVKKNYEEIKKIYKKYAEDADLVVFPELCLTGYTCGDLFLNQNLLENSKMYLVKLAELTQDYEEVGAGLVVGLPLEVKGELFNCAAFLHNGEIAAIIPKTYLPNYGEFYEKRWFSARKIEADYLDFNEEMECVPFGNQQLIHFGSDIAQEPSLHQPAPRLRAAPEGRPGRARRPCPSD